MLWRGLSRVRAQDVRICKSRLPGFRGPIEAAIQEAARFLAASNKTLLYPFWKIIPHFKVLFIFPEDQVRASRERLIILRLHKNACRKLLWRKLLKVGRPIYEPAMIPITQCIITDMNISQPEIAILQEVNQPSRSVYYDAPFLSDCYYYIRLTAIGHQPKCSISIHPQELQGTRSR